MSRPGTSLGFRTFRDDYGLRRLTARAFGTGAAEGDAADRGMECLRGRASEREPRTGPVQDAGDAPDRIPGLPWASDRIRKARARSVIPEMIANTAMSQTSASAPAPGNSQT
jgi:hypothetical protein